MQYLVMRAKTLRNLAMMICFDIILVIVTIIFSILYYRFGRDWMLSVAVTFLTISYHFIMRLVVGQSVTVRYRNREFNMNSFGFRLHKFEPELYRQLKVKRWKSSMITARPEQFDLKDNDLKSLLHNILQAELVHRIIMVLSFVPILFIIPFGAPVVFIITSVLASFVDLQFVIIQRYNRPRVVRMIEMQKKLRGI